MRKTVYCTKIGAVRPIQMNRCGGGLVRLNRSGKIPAGPYARRSVKRRRFETFSCLPTIDDPAHSGRDSRRACKPSEAKYVLKRRSAANVKKAAH